MYKSTVLKEEREQRMKLRHSQGTADESPKKKKRVSFHVAPQTLLDEKEKSVLVEEEDQKCGVDKKLQTSKQKTTDEGKHDSKSIDKLHTSSPQALIEQFTDT